MLAQAVALFDTAYQKLDVQAVAFDPFLLAESRLPGVKRSKVAGSLLVMIDSYFLSILMDWRLEKVDDITFEVFIYLIQ